jgi:hypothetical protein
MVAKGFIGDGIQFARFHVSFDLTIPCIRIELGEPPPKLCEFLMRETGDPETLISRASTLLMEKTIPPSLFAG